MATSTNRRRPSQAGNQAPGSMAPLVAPAMLAAAALALYFQQPGLVLVWLGALVAALVHPPVELTGKKDSYGRNTPADLTEEKKLADFEAMRSLRWRLVAPGAHWLPGWPPLGYWLLAVALTFLAWNIPVSELPVLADNDDEGAQQVSSFLVTFGPALNSAATFLTTTAAFATLRQRAGDDCPGTRMNALVTIAKAKPVRTALMTLGAPAVGAGLVIAAKMVAPEISPLIDAVPVAIWVALALILAVGVHAVFMREESLRDWQILVAARRQWDARWPAVKMNDPMATLVERRTVGQNTVDTFDAPPSVGATGYLMLAPKLTPVLGAGRTVVILNDPQVGPDGAPVPGTTDPIRFRIVDIDANEPVDLTDPATEPEVASTIVEAGMAQATDMLGLPRASLLALEPVHAEDSSRAAWRATFAGLSWATLRPQVAMMPGFFGGTETLVDHRGQQMFVGALLTEPASMTDPKLPEHLENLSIQDHWNVVWGAASLARHKVSQPAVSPAQCSTSTLADGTQVERIVFITRVGIPPQDYFGTEDKVAASLNGAPFVAITGYPGTGNRPGERHPQAMCVYSSTRPVPATLDALAPVEGSSIAVVDHEQDRPTRPGRGDRRRPMRRPMRSRPTPSTELATHWVIAGMMNKAFEANRLKRPEVVEARSLTNPESRGNHLWRVQLRLHDGVTLSDVRASAEKLRQSLGVPWLRVAQAPDGVTVYAGATPAGADLVNPVTDQATLVSLDWERAFDDAKLVSAAGEVPRLLEVDHLPRNADVQVLDFALPSGLSTDRIKGALKKLMASTGNEFVELRPSPRGASSFRLLVAVEHPLPSRVDFDFEVASADPRFIYFATGIEGEPVGWEVKEQPHILVAGTTGSGKSVLAQNFLWGWAAHGGIVVVIDPMKQAADFQFLAPYAAGFAVDVIEAAALLKAVYAEVRQRMSLNASHKVGSYMELPEDIRPRRMLVFIDEFTSLMGKDPVPAQSTDPEVMEERARVEALNEARSTIGTMVGKIAREARSAGVHLALGTQALKSDTLQKLPGGSDLKDLALDTLLPVPVSDRFPTGWARNDELVVGDLLYAPDGTTTPILGFSETMFGHDVYEVVFDDGQVVKAGAGHLWQVSRTDAVEGWRDVPMVLTTAQLVHLVADGQEWSVPAAEAVPGHPEARGVPARAVREVRQVESVPTRCIGVAHPDHLFLVEGFIPTHNTNLARTLLGNSTQGDRMSALRNPMDAPALGDSIPKGRGLWEPLTSPVASAVQTWFAPPSQLEAELGARIEPLEASQLIDYSKFMPRDEQDDHTYGPPPGFGEDAAGPDTVDVADLGDIDVIDLDVDLGEIDLTDLEDGDTEPVFDLSDLEADDDHDDTEEGGAGQEEADATTTAPAEADTPSRADPFEEWDWAGTGGEEGGGAPETGEDRPGLVDEPEQLPPGLPVRGGADAAVRDAGGGDPGPGPRDDDGDGAAPDPGGPDVAGVDPAAADEERLHRVSSPWDDDDEFDGPAVVVAPDRRKLSTEELLD